MRGIRIVMTRPKDSPADWNYSFIVGEKRDGDDGFVTNTTIRENLEAIHARPHQKIGEIILRRRFNTSEATLTYYHPLGDAYIPDIGEIPIFPEMVGKGIASLLEYKTISHFKKMNPHVQTLFSGGTQADPREVQLKKRRILPGVKKPTNIDVFLNHLRWKIARNAFKNNPSTQRMPRKNIRTVLKRIKKRRPSVI